jgi:hypothetical protein
MSSTQFDSVLAKKLNTFVALSNAELKCLADLQVHRVKVPRGQQLTREGQSGHKAFVLQAGWACSFKTLPDGGRQIISFPIAGDIVGLRSVLLRTADHSFSALTDADYLSTEKHFDEEAARMREPSGELCPGVAAEVLDDVWMPMIPFVLLTLGVAVLSIRRSLVGLVRAAKRAEGISPLDTHERFDISGMPREAAIFATAINARSITGRGRPASRATCASASGSPARPSICRSRLESDRGI